MTNYQRPYDWEREQISHLIEDLLANFNEKQDRYFCGSIVLAKSKDGRFDIIDGQQRLTTFVILCCVLCDFLLVNLRQGVKIMFRTL